MPFGLGRFVLVLLALAAALGQQIVPGHVLEGTVTDSVTGAPISGAVVIVSAAGKTAYRSTSDTNGSFRIDGVLDGDYRTDFSATGFVAPAMNSAVTRQVRMRGSNVRADVKLVPAGAVSGRVLDPDEQPVPGAEVTLQVAGSLVAQTVRTDATATFHFGRVSPGSYFLDALPPKELKAPKPVGGEIFGWMRTFYPNTPEKASAARIGVAAGGNLSGQNIRLRAVPVHRTGGVVFTDRGEPARNAKLTLVLDNEVPIRETYTFTAPDGSFAFPGIHDGGWRLSATAETEGKKTSAFSWLQVAGRSIDNIELHLASPFTVQATVELPGDPNKPGGCVVLAPEGGGSGDEVGQDCSGMRGLSFPKVFERSYRVFPIVPPPGDYYLSSIKLGEQDVLGEAVDFRPGSPPIRVIYGSNGGVLKGRVEDCSGATVVAMPQEPALRSSVYFRLIRSAACADNGTYQIANLRPGTYYVFAFDQDSMKTADFTQLDQYFLNRAATARVREGETENADLKITPRAP